MHDPETKTCLSARAESMRRRVRDMREALGMGPATPSPPVGQAGGTPVFVRREGPRFTWSPRMTRLVEEPVS